MRTRRFTFLLILLAACNRDDARAVADAAPPMDPAQLQNSSGEVSLTDGGAMSYAITSDRYKQWYAAQDALDHATAAKFGTILHPNSPSAASIARATAFLSGNPRTKLAIEHAGMTVRAFVEMTVALQQQFRDAATSPGDAYPSDLPYYVPPPLDTALPPPPMGAVPMTPMPAYTPTSVDTMMYRATPDTVRPALPPPPARTPVVTSIPMPATRVDSAPRRDSAALPAATPVSPPKASRPPTDTTGRPRRDTGVGRASVTPAPRPDTDATHLPAPAPRDSLSRR